VLANLERVSKPGRRIYRGSRELPWVLSGMGIAIVSTPKGVMTGREARRLNVGGEVLCYIW
jgi:small subunit ribosomal protein S8